MAAKGINRVSLAGRIIAQGEKAVGAATVQLIANSTACSRVWLGAPTAKHQKGAVNTTIVLVGGSAAGGIPLDPTNAAGFWFPVTDASMLYFTGFTAGDVVEYLIVG